MSSHCLRLTGGSVVAVMIWLKYGYEDIAVVKISTVKT
jgi:hypothetical protein